MALYLAVAVIAAVNVALASQLSLRPEQKAPNIEGRPIFCMIVLFSTAIISGISLILLSINIDLFFTMSVGTLALSSIVISIYHVSKFFDFELPKCMRKTRLSALSLILSSLTFILLLPDQTCPCGSQFLITAPFLPTTRWLTRRICLFDWVERVLIAPSSSVYYGRRLRSQPVSIRVGTCGTRLPLVWYQVWRLLHSHPLESAAG